jgi:glycosyltransferase involved in cell wall biosynthesis
VPKPCVVHLVESLEIGGAEKLVCDFVMGRGADATSVICLEVIGALGESLRAQGFRVDLVGMKSRWRTIDRLRSLLKRERPDILHCHNFTAHLYGAMAARLVGGIRVLMTKHGALVPHRSPTGLLNRWLARTTQVVAVSPEALQVMKPWERPDGKPILYIANGISLRPYEKPVSREDARDRLGWSRGNFMVGIVARVTAIKGHVRLVEVFSRILKRIPSAMLVIVGDGTAREAVERRIDDLGLEPSVYFLGERQDVPLILSALNVFCLPSETEGMPITLLEAMAASRPVVVSTVGAIPAVVEDRVSGILISPFDSDAIEQALLSLAEDPQRAALMGEAGRRRVARDFSSETALRNYEEVYQGMLDANKY